MDCARDYTLTGFNEEELDLFAERWKAAIAEDCGLGNKV